MKYYSELTKEMYDTEVKLREAETDYKIAEIEANKRAAEKERRWKEVLAAKKKYEELFEKYSKDYTDGLAKWFFDFMGA